MGKPLERKQYYSSTEVAEICEVDPKTVHNWADDGTLPAFRSPGRHLRVHYEDLVKFLAGHGYKVPQALETKPARQGA